MTNYVRKEKTMAKKKENVSTSAEKTNKVKIVKKTIEERVAKLEKMVEEIRYVIGF